MTGLRFFPLKSADVCGAGTRDEPLRTSAWEATSRMPGNICFVHLVPHVLVKFDLKYYIILPVAYPRIPTQQL